MGRRLILVLERSCLACGEPERETDSNDPKQWPTGPGVPPPPSVRCQRCGSSMVFASETSTIVKVIEDVEAMWGDLRRRLGRPPRWLVEQRARADAGSSQ